jgi:hypothetical protein
MGAPQPHRYWDRVRHVLHPAHQAGALLTLAGIASRPRPDQASAQTVAPVAVTQEALRGVMRGGDRYVSVGNAGTILASADGRTWTAQPPVVQDTLWNVIYADGAFYATGHISSRFQVPGSKLIAWVHLEPGTWNLELRPLQPPAFQAPEAVQVFHDGFADVDARVGVVDPAYRDVLDAVAAPLGQDQ